MEGFSPVLSLQICSTIKKICSFASSISLLTQAFGFSFKGNFFNCKSVMNAKQFFFD